VHFAAFAFEEYSVNRKSREENAKNAKTGLAES
jgi:hypothetical protein